MSENFFHAYVVGGHREDARVFIDSFLKQHGVNTEKGPDYTISEHVILTIDHVRALREWQNLSSVGKQKVYVLYTTFITAEAENALLKTLEEPVSDTHIILAMPKPEMLLPTLLSRVQVLIPENNTHGGVKKVEDFLKMTVGERLEFVKKMVEKSDDEYASAEVREKAVTFFDDLENYFAGKLKMNSEIGKKEAEKIESILKLKKYLYVPASSVRSLMETVALTI